MKRRLTAVLTLVSMLVCTLIMPVINVSAATEKVKLYGNSIPVHTKQICFVKGTEGSSILGPEYYAPGFKKYYYVGDNVINFKTVAKQLPELQNIAVVQCDVKNLSSLEGMKDLVWLGLYQCEGADDLSFLKKLPGLTKFRYSHIYMDKGCKSIKPISYLKNLNELYLHTDYKCVEDIAPLKGLTKLKKLEISNFGGKNISVLKNLKSLKELDIEINSAEKVDISVLGELQKLEKLSVTSDGSRTRLSGLPEIIKLKKLKDLTINGFDYEDLSFMGEMKGLDSLSIWYSNGTFSKTIGELTNLKSLALNEISGTGSRDMSFISKLKSLESLRVSGSRRLSLDGASKLKKLKSVSIMLCEFKDLSELKKCPALEDLLVYNCNSDFDVSWISGSGLKDVSISAGGSGCLKNMDKLSTLKSADRIALDFTGISENTIKKIKKAVPDCRIEVYELNYYGNYEPIVY